MFSIFVRPSINDLLQSYKQVIDVVSSPNCALSIDRIIAGFTWSLVRNLTTVSCVIAEGSICLLIVVSTEGKRQVASAFWASEMCELEPRSKSLTRSLLEGKDRKGREGGKHCLLPSPFLHPVVRMLDYASGSAAKDGGGYYRHVAIRFNGYRQRYFSIKKVPERIE
jgi:hypothetical protein